MSAEQISLGILVQFWQTQWGHVNGFDIANQAPPLSALVCKVLRMDSTCMEFFWFKREWIRGQFIFYPRSVVLEKSVKKVHKERRGIREKKGAGLC